MSEKMRRERTIYFHAKEIISTDGETVHNESVSVKRIDGEPPYVKLYLDDISRLYELQSESKNLLLELLSRMDFETNEIFVN
jgi:hypothetical protein